MIGYSCFYFFIYYIVYTNRAIKRRTYNIIRSRVKFNTPLLKKRKNFKIKKKKNILNKKKKYLF
jgi:hypothetical protein